MKYLFVHQKIDDEQNETTSTRFREEEEAVVKEVM